MVNYQRRVRRKAKGLGAGALAAVFAVCFLAALAVCYFTEFGQRLTWSLALRMAPLEVEPVYVAAAMVQYVSIVIGIVAGIFGILVSYTLYRVYSPMLKAMDAQRRQQQQQR
jgi:uncharacterized oligopeptide transporter (OPT) family protein